MPRQWIQKAEPERYTLGVVYEPDTLDTDDEYATADTIQRAQRGFMAKLQGEASVTAKAMQFVEALCKAAGAPGGARVDITALLEHLEKGRLGDQHATWNDDYGTVTDCYIAPCDMVVNGQEVRQGSWLLGVVWSPEQFAKIVSGERTGYSMGGTGQKIYREGGRNAA